MKTLHLTNCWHAASGGISTFYRELLRQADVEGRPIRLVVPGAEDSVEHHGRYGRIYRIRGRHSPFSPGYRMIMPGDYLFPRAKVREILAKERAQVVECCDKYTLNYLAGLLRRGWYGIPNYRPAVVGLTCERMDENFAGYLYRGKLAKTFCRLYMQWLYFPLFDHHIAVSPHTAGELLGASFGHRKKRGVWLRPMGADCTVFTPARRTARFRQWLESCSGTPEGATLLLYAGRLAPEKNLDLLIETMRELEQRSTGQYHLLIAGEGPLRGAMEQRYDRELPGAVYFLGHVREREMLAGIYANCDALLHPNPREPFGIAPLEAMASGLLVIAPASGGITCYANASNALLVSASAESFAAAAADIREFPQLGTRLGREGRATAERFDWATVTSSFFALYDELYAMVQGSLDKPATAPAFYSTYPEFRRRIG